MVQPIDNRLNQIPPQLDNGQTPCPHLDVHA